jgi:cytochrome b561
MRPRARAPADAEVAADHPRKRDQSDSTIWTPSVPLPPVWPADRALSERLFVLHRWLGIAIGVVVAMHIAAALHHHFVRGDRVLMRMVTG